MSVATLRLGRRSMELMHMTLEEVQCAEQKEVEGEVFHIVQVLKQKSLKMGEPAPVVFSDVEFKVLQLFILKMRSTITGDSYNPICFPSQQQRASSNHMTFSSFHSIINKLQTTPGKNVTSRAIRGSKITHNRSLNVSDSERRNLAKSMSHSVATAERFYNYNDINNSVVESLSLSKNRALDQSFDPSFASGNTSTPIKGAKRCVDESESSLDITLQDLRNKKVKISSQHEHEHEKEKQVDNAKGIIAKVVERMKSNGDVSSLKTATGQICVLPVTAQIAKGVTRLLSTKDLRIIIQECLDE